MKNDYKVLGDTTVIYLKRKDGVIMETLIDTKDLELVSSVRGTWYANLDKSSGKYYVKVGISRNGKVQKIPMHRFLFGEPEGMSIDHENQDTLKNTRNNLRVLIIQHNQQNRSNNGSRGVTWHKRDKRWIGQVRVDGKNHFIGYFDDKEEAVEEVRKARKILLPYSLN